MRRNWILRSADETCVQQLSQAFGFSPLLARLLVARGFSTPEQAVDFLCSDLSALASPDRLADLPQAVALLRQAAAAREPIWVIGDDDVDGLTGSAILFRTLRQMGAVVQVEIPHRQQEGYGLNADRVRQTHAGGAKVLVAVDCGTTQFAELELARSLGIRTVVVDHHDLAPEGRPPADAFLNPLRSDSGYPERELASVGVAFTLARGLLQGTSQVWDHLDLAALGTIADWSELTGENRILVRAGLHALRGTSKPGLRTLLRRAGLAEERAVEVEEVSFLLAPPLNAAGRMGSAQAALRLLITDDPAEAEEAATELFRQNRSRSASERLAFKEALVKVAREVNFNRERVIVLEDERWHPGVVGILATRLTSRFHRPTVVIAVQGTLGRGSARSIPSFHLVEALQQVREHLVTFGGHPGAAGLTIHRDRIASFREAINRTAWERIPPERLTPQLDLDAEFPLEELTDDLLRDLERLGPFGHGNPRPIFSSHGVRFSNVVSFGEGPRPPFRPWGVYWPVTAAGGRMFHAFHPRELAGESTHPRRIRGSVRLAYSPIRRRGEEVTVELRVRDVELP